EAAKKGLAQASDALRRLKYLADNGAVPKAKADQAQSQYDTALTQEQGAEQNLKKVNAGPTKEDLDAAQAQVAKAQAGLQEAITGARARNETSAEDVASAKIGVQNAEQSLRTAEGGHAQ